MPAKTNSDLIYELNGLVRILEDRSLAARQSIDKLISANETLRGELADTGTRLALLESQQANLRAAQDEKDRRRWTVWVAVIGSLLTLAANVALTAWKR